MKIINWNLNHTRSTKSFNYALKNFSADIYFFQECFHPLTYLNYDEYAKYKSKFVWEPTGSGWGNLIISQKFNLKPIKVKHEFKGRFLAGMIKNNIEKPLILFNFHVPITGKFSRFNLQDMFSLSGKLFKSNNIIIAGDFNFGQCFDKDNSTDCKDFLGNILEKYNLINCYKQYNDIEEQTFRPPRKPDSNIHIDYILISSNIKKDLKDCRIISSKEIVGLSDRKPLEVSIF